MLGLELLVAPAVTPMAAGGDEATVAVWFPPDVSWVRTSFGRDECAERGMRTVYSAPPADQASARSKQRLAPGGVWHNVTATINEVPVFARAGAIVPLLPAPQAAQLGAASRSYTHLQFDLFCDQGASSGECTVEQQATAFHHVHIDACCVIQVQPACALAFARPGCMRMMASVMPT